MDGSDLELLKSAVGGDDRAFHALIDRHATVLFRAALSLSRNRADAEDLMQETMIGAYRSMHRFAGRSSVKTWLLQIMTRQAAKAWHKGKHRRSTLSLSGSGTDETDRPMSDAIPSHRSTAQSVERKMDVMEILQKLSAPHREVLVLREIQGLTYEEMAEALNVPRGTVESRLSRARAEFRAHFGGEEG